MPPHSFDKKHPDVSVPDPSALEQNGDNAKANAEHHALKNGRDLALEREVGEHDRSEGFHFHFYYACVAFFWMAIAIGILMFSVYSFYLVGPSEYHWLSEWQVDKIELIMSNLFSGAVGAFIGQYFRNRLIRE